MLFESDESSLWPIISSIGTYNYNLVKFLTELLDPVIPKEYRAKDSFRFSEEIQQVSSNDNILVSYNVCSLFESMTLQETIEIEVELIFENNAQLKVMKRELTRNNYLLLQPQVPILFSMVAFMNTLMGYQCISGISLRSCPCQFVHGLSRKEMVARIWQRKDSHV